MCVRFIPAQRIASNRLIAHLTLMSVDTHSWGNPPWAIDFRAAHHPLPQKTDVAIVGGGFTGLAAAAWLRHISPETTVALFDAESIGAGASGRTGGMALSETAAGDLPGLGDVLKGFGEILRALRVDGDFNLTGAWEICRSGGIPHSPIEWSDSGTLRVTEEVAGGSIDPGKLVSGLAHAAQDAGAHIFENLPIDEIAFENRLRLQAAGREIQADRVLIATNAQSLELSALGERTSPRLTLALATEPLSDRQIEELGLDSHKPFYTVDFPYLWGRMLRNKSVIFGSGLVDAPDGRDLHRLSVKEGKTKELLDRLETRVRKLHPAVHKVAIAHRWGGPILLTEGWTPIFQHHPRSDRVIVLGGYCGHGVVLSSYLGAWAAEALLGRRTLPEWDGNESAED